MWKNVHSVFGTGIRTHDLLDVSLLQRSGCCSSPSAEELHGSAILFPPFDETIMLHD